MVAEPWLQKITNHVVTSKKSNKKSTKIQETIGILSFEIANLMSKTIRFHKSLTNSKLAKLKTDILTSDGVKTLVSPDETYLLDLVLSENLQELNFIARSVSRLGKKCTMQHLQGFEHVYIDIVNGKINVMDLGVIVKDMDATVRKMERFVNSTVKLYGEMQVLNELEIAIKKFQQNRHEESMKVFEQKLMWQVQDVRHLKDVSLWNQSFDKIVEMLARSVCTLYARLCFVFVDAIDRRDIFSSTSCRSLREKFDGIGSNSCNSSTFVEKKAISVRPQVETRKIEMNLLKDEDQFKFDCGLGPRKLLMECLSIGSSVSTMDDFDENGSIRTSNDRSSRVSGSCSVSSSVKKEVLSHSSSFNRAPFKVDSKGHKSSMMKSLKSVPQSRLMVQAPLKTVGGSGLALHYANVIIVIEKLIQYPHLVGEEARDDLYQMLPTSLRLRLRRNLKSCAKDLAIYDAPLAHDWKDRLDGILGWLAPMAHNMIRWQSERNYEQQQIVSRTNVLLLQTLYFADRDKTEAAMCELLVGLNYICRYEHQQNALMDCASSFDLDDCTDWQLQY
uniref:uncharacterized protein LOC122585116 n=1 Tax=Erigeron canadensis TaxID=72917 RepID=UPI001CB97388|nr:uncharacterized protein LOC122585116 [Erigeron canadensis]